MVVRLVPTRISSLLPARGASLIAALVLLVGAGCAGNDDVEPTGRIVVFGSPELTLIPAAGGELEYLRLGDYEFWDAALSADGSQVAFNPRSGIEAAGIAVMTLGDGSATVVQNQPSQDEPLSWGVAWAPDGKGLAFVNGDRVFTISIDGSNLRELGSGVFPVWTPDSEHIVFAAGRKYTGRDMNIAVIRADGMDRRILGRGLYPDVSPSGEDVAYSTSTGVYVVPLAGGEPRLVVPNGFGPEWSPDGKFLAFTRYTDCGNGHGVCSGRVFVVSADGGEPRPVGPLVGDPAEPLDWIR